MPCRRLTIPQLLTEIDTLSTLQYGLSDDQAGRLISAVSNLFKKFLESQGVSSTRIKALRTKFRDAGRRSAPWQATSSVVPGRPQDGDDGNRINRWLLPSDHKFYATEVIATLVEVKYYFQCLSMEGAPPLPPNTIQDKFDWLLGHSIVPGCYLDPIQLLPINFTQVLQEPRLIQSGHLHPLDRGGVHHPTNTFLMLARSNQLQGNLTIEELLDLMRYIVAAHNH